MCSRNSGTGPPGAYSDTRRRTSFVTDFASYVQDTAPTGIRLTLTPFQARFGVRGRAGRSSVVV
jgi:hypothetical protein